LLLVRRPVLYHGTDEKIALAASCDPQSEITHGCILERPKVVFNRKSGQFVMWFHLEFKGTGSATARTAVATAPHVTGPYRYIKSFRPNAGVWPINWDPAASDQGAELFRCDFE
jgi:hypothetical protein